MLWAVSIDVGRWLIQNSCLEKIPDAVVVGHMELAASQQTGNWKLEQVDGTEIKDPLEPHYIMTC